MLSRTLLPVIHHQPYGEQHPYDPLPCERMPRDPSAGEPVTLGVETGSIPSADAVWCIWQVEGNSGSNRTEAVKQAVGENADHWQVQLPSFKGGDVVQYRLFAQSGQLQVQSEEFIFGVSSWVDVRSVATMEENVERLVVMLTTSCPGLYVHLQAEPDPTGAISLRLSSFYENNTLPFSPSSKEPVTVKLGDVRITLQGDPLGIVLCRESDGLKLQSTDPIQVLVCADGTVVCFRVGFYSPSNEAFYGFGERFNSLDQRGNHLDNYVYGQYTSQGKRSYIPIPFFISSRGYGLWLKTERQAEFDLAAAENDRWKLTGHVEENCNLEMKFFFQKTPSLIVQAYTDLTGKPQLPPPWVFGLWMSSNDWNNQSEVLRQLALTQEHEIPATVVVIEAWSDEINFYIWNDAQYKQKPSSLAYNLRDYTFPKTGHWPEPRAMIDTIHTAGLRLVLWQIPVMKYANPAENLDETQKDVDQEFATQNRFVVQNSIGNPHRIETHSPWFGNSLVFDFTNQEAVDWWFKKREYLLTELSVDGFKTDGGEHIWDKETHFKNGMHGSRGINFFPVAYEGAYDRFLRTHRGEDYVLFSRAGYTGVQKFSCHWTGDENSTWDAFRATLRAMLNVGLCGVSFIGWDLAGFAGPIPGSELYLRATAFSVFCPIMQYHSDYNARREPSRDRTPWNIQEQTGDPDVLPIFRKFMNLRMNLIPYILGQARLSSQTGLPLMRALPFDFPSSATSREFPYEYFFGEALLVVPVVEEGVTSWKVYLPEGEWRDLWSGTVFKGNQEITFPAPREQIPVFQRRGSIVPLNLGDTVDLGSPVGNSPEEIKNLAALVYPGEACRADVYQGKGFPYGDISAQQVEENGHVKVVLKGLNCAVDLLVLGNEPRQVSVNGIFLKRLDDCARSTAAYWVWMPNRYMACIHLPPHKGTAAVILS